VAILTVTPNAAIDRTLLVPGFRTNGVFRETQRDIRAGGKGINVARAVASLGKQAECCGFLGGWTGKYIAELAQRDHLPSHWTWIEGESRSCTIIVDSETRDNTVINERGTPITSQDWERLTEEVRQHVTNKYVCFSGSLPPGSPLDKYNELLGYCVENSRCVWVDASGNILESALKVPGIKAKVNHHEIGTIIGRTIPGPSYLSSAIPLLRALGLQELVITFGSRGAAFLTQGEVWFAASPPVDALCAVGSGDSFFAGLLVGQASGLPVPDQLKMATAAGAANTLTLGAGFFTLPDYENILAQVHVEQL